MCYPLFTRIWVKSIDSPKVCIRVITGIFIGAIHVYQLIITYRVLFYCFEVEAHDCTKGLAPEFQQNMQFVDS